MTEQEPEPGARIWRVLPEFPKYEINSDGQVRNRRTQRELVETEDRRNGTWYYSLSTGKAHKAKRVYEKLLYSAFPELDPGWKTIPGFSEYEIDRHGQVRGKHRYKPIKRAKGDYYRLYKYTDGVRTRHYWREDAA